MNDYDYDYYEIHFSEKDLYENGILELKPPLIEQEYFENDFEFILDYFQI